MKDLQYPQPTPTKENFVIEEIPNVGSRIKIHPVAGLEYNKEIDKLIVRLEYQTPTEIGSIPLIWITPDSFVQQPGDMGSLEFIVPIGEEWKSDGPDQEGMEILDRELREDWS